MKKILLSFIIPTLNEQRLLPKLLSDLKSQKATNFEIIVVDARSDDGTIDEILKFEKLLPLRLIETKKRNVAFQKNMGAHRAKGQYLIFIDADCRIPTIFTRELQKSIESNKRLMYFPKVEALNGTQVDERLFEIFNHTLELSQVIGRPLATAGCMIFEAGIFKFIGEFDPKILERRGIGEDHEIIVRARQYGIVAKCLKTVTYKYSLRRFEKEGRLQTLQKYVISTVERLTYREFPQGPIEYEMGGHHFESTHSLAKALSFDRKLLNRLKNIRKLIIDQNFS
jgi:glycosyltransferase involved in cell wall biosynthesis